VKYKIIGIIVALFSTSILFASHGCMTNSWHLTKPFDNKEYHYVSCACPCTSYSKYSPVGYNLFYKHGIFCENCGHAVNFRYLNSRAFAHIPTHILVYLKLFKGPVHPKGTELKKLFGTRL